MRLPNKSAIILKVSPDFAFLVRLFFFISNSMIPFVASTTRSASPSAGGIITQTAAAVRPEVRPRRRMPLSRFQAQSPREAGIPFSVGRLHLLRQVHPISRVAAIPQTQASHYTQCGRVTMRPQKPFGTQAANGEKSATIAA